jgi:hypothetical protein
MRPHFEDAGAVCFVETLKVFEAGPGNEVLAYVVEEPSVGIENKALCIGHPLRGRAELGEHTVALFAAPKFFFVALALRDVDDDAAEAERSAISVVRTSAARRNPPQGTVRLLNAVLGIELRASLYCLFDRRSDRRQIFTDDVSRKLRNGNAGGSVPRVYAVQMSKARVRVDQIVLHIPVPNADAIGSGKGEREAYFTLPASLIEIVLLGDVAVMQRNATIDGKDADAQPHTERGIEEGIDGTFDTLLHDVVVDLVDRRTNGFGIELPVSLVVVVFRTDAADASGRLVGVGNAPTRIQQHDAIRKTLYHPQQCRFNSVARSQADLCGR